MLNIYKVNKCTDAHSFNHYLYAYNLMSLVLIWVPNLYIQLLILSPSLDVLKSSSDLTIPKASWWPLTCFFHCLFKQHLVMQANNPQKSKLLSFWSISKCPLLFHSATQVHTNNSLRLLNLLMPFPSWPAPYKGDLFVKPIYDTHLPKKVSQALQRLLSYDPHPHILDGPEC